jgi:hypothetical protein
MGANTSIIHDHINYTTVAIIPGNEIINRAYKSSTNQIEYLGYAYPGTSNSEDKWIIRKYSYNVNNQVETERMARNIAWDDRETASYA